MLCPICGGDSKVLDTRTNESVNSVKRRRECMKCGKRFTTYERIEDMPLIVRKKSGRTELFDKSKILKSPFKKTTPSSVQGSYIFISIQFLLNFPLDTLSKIPPLLVLRQCFELWIP